MFTAVTFNFFKEVPPDPELNLGPLAFQPAALPTTSILTPHKVESVVL